MHVLPGAPHQANNLVAKTRTRNSDSCICRGEKHCRVSTISRRKLDLQEGAGCHITRCQTKLSIDDKYEWQLQPAKFKGRTVMFNL